MVDPRLAMIAAAVALYAAPALAQDDPQGVCDRCEASQARYERQAYVTRSESVTRVSYSQGYLSWPGKDGGQMAGPQGRGPEYGPDAYGPPPCPPVRPGERVISCRYLPYAQPAQQADIAPAGGVLYADGGVGPEYIPGGGGGGGTTIIEGGSNASSGSSSSSSASASASASASINISENFNQHPYKKGGGGGSWGGGSMGGGGSWPSGSMGGSGGGSWPSGSMSSGGGSWPSGSMGSSGSGGVGGRQSGGHGGSHGHGKK